MSWKRNRAQFVAPSAGVLLAAWTALAATPIYEPKDADVASEAVTCRRVGKSALSSDVFAQRTFWTTQNYENKLGIEVGGVRDGMRGLCIDGSAKTCDTAWNATSGKITLTGAGRRYRLGFRVDTTVAIRLPNSDGETWRSAIFWQDANGKEISREPIAYSIPKGRQTSVAVYGDIPAGAAACSLRGAFDRPNIGPVDRVVYSGLSFEELAEPPSYAAEASFVSEVHEGGAVSWHADVPAGCAVRFQWRGASTPGEPAKRPCAGPGGTDKTFYNAPFTADAPFVQYRAVLHANGQATPALREVTIGERKNCDWALSGDAKPPRILRVSASPTRNAAEPLRIKVKDAASVVMWDSLKVTVDGADKTTMFTRAGNEISLVAPTNGWAQGLHTAEVCVADFHGYRAKSRKMFYVGDAPSTPKVTLRDDGMTLIDGKPFFAIGLYAVCKREFNGNNFDVAFKGLKEAGFNLAHTYGNAYEPDFLAAAEKYGVKLWVQARFPDKRLIEVGRHHPSIIAWYLGDDTADHIPSELEADYDEAVKAVDPTRITVQADPIGGGTPGSISRYADYVTAMDGFLPEIYPVRREAGDPTDATCVAQTIRDMKQVAEDVRRYGKGTPRTCWAIIQYFKGWSGWKHFPTREQLFAMTYAAVIHGAHGVTWYTYGGFNQNEGVTSTPERWRNICDLAAQLAELAPVLVERTPPQPSVPTITSGPKTDPFGGPSVTCLLKRHDGWNYLLAVNASTESVSAKLSAAEATTVEVLHENRTCAVVNGHLADDLAPFAVHVYRWRQTGGETCLSGQNSVE